MELRQLQCSNAAAISLGSCIGEKQGASGAGVVATLLNTHAEHCSSRQSKGSAAGACTDELVRSQVTSSGFSISFTSSVQLPNRCAAERLKRGGPACLNLAVPVSRSQPSLCKMALLARARMPGLRNVTAYCDQYKMLYYVATYSMQRRSLRYSC